MKFCCEQVREGKCVWESAANVLSDAKEKISRRASQVLLLVF